MSYGEVNLGFVWHVLVYILLTLINFFLNLCDLGSIFGSLVNILLTSYKALIFSFFHSNISKETICFRCYY